MDRSSFSSSAGEERRGGGRKVIRNGMMNVALGDDSGGKSKSVSEVLEKGKVGGETRISV